MIETAKVSLVAVRTFCSAVKDVSANTEKFAKGITCLEQMREEFSKAAQGLRDKLDAMQSARAALREKIDSIEEIINELQSQIDALESEVSALESELSATRPSFTVARPEGDVSVPNPRYLALEVQISSKKAAIGTLSAKMLPHQSRLERAKLIEYKLLMHVDKVRAIVCSLEEKKVLCERLISELTEVKVSNATWCMNAVEGLTSIERVVNSYVRIKMKYDTVVQSEMQQNPNRQNGINIVININKTDASVAARREEQAESSGNQYSQEEIDKHRIKFDEFKRICEYDGRKYGGKYVPYEERRKRSMADNPVLGRYLGERGESKYIPSSRSVEGIIVQQILAERGLDGIVYRNAEPEFEPCAEAVVTIQAMTGNREDYFDSFGNQQKGNFTQADEELAKIWNFEEKDSKTNWTARDVYKYRKANKLTWHEKCDMETMVLVRTEINDFFKHSGGCAECNARDAYDEGDDFDE